jgi:endoribonuclease Dicer
MSIISKRFLGAVNVILGFHKRMRVSELEPLAIDAYSTDVLLAREGSNAPNFLTIMAPPKVLPDVLHAFIGALIVDSEYNYSVVEGSFIIHPHLLGGHVALQDDSVGHGTKSFERYKTIRCRVCSG